MRASCHVAAERATRTEPVTAAAALAAWSHASAFAVAPRSSSTPAVRAQSLPVHRDHVGHPGHCDEASTESRAVQGSHDAERRVVPGCTERPADCGIDQIDHLHARPSSATRRASSSTGPTATPCAARAVDARKFAVRSEATASAVDRVELALNRGARVARQRVVVLGRYDCSGPSPEEDRHGATGDDDRWRLPRACGAACGAARRTSRRDQGRRHRPRGLRGRSYLCMLHRVMARQRLCGEKRRRQRPALRPPRAGLMWCAGGAESHRLDWRLSPHAPQWSSAT